MKNKNTTILTKTESLFEIKETRDVFEFIVSDRSRSCFKGSAGELFVSKEGKLNYQSRQEDGSVIYDKEGEIFGFDRLSGIEVEELKKYSLFKIKTNPRGAKVSFVIYNLKPSEND